MTRPSIAVLASSVLAGLLPAAPAHAQPPPPAAYAITAVDTAHGDREFHLLWPDGAPGALGAEAVDKPKVTVYRAPADKATGAAVVVCPGGGYQVVAADHEGKQVAEWLNSLGVSAFVLQYRLGPRYRHPAPLQDALRAIRLVRSRAREWGVDPGRVGILGFSAGGHLASTAATHFDDGRTDAADPPERESSRPDFAVLCYAVVSLFDPPAHSGSRRNLLGDPADPKLVELLSNERQVTARTPPTFLWHTADDAAVPVANSLLFFEAMAKAGVPGELHVFPHGRHGVGLAPDDPVLSQWPRLCATWMGSLGLLKRGQVLNCELRRSPCLASGIESLHAGSDLGIAHSGGDGTRVQRVGREGIHNARQETHRPSNRGAPPPGSPGAP